uniref:Peptidylprolyl isomerase n=1 Tax=Strongyloides venezuelensis TaxID=75913 RepID=A0A0K0FJ83_STRVS
MKDEQNIAYSINLKKDIEKYIKDIGGIADDMKVLEGILFVDDFSSGQVLGPFRNKVCEAFENDGNDDNIISHEYVMLELPEKHATFGNNISKQFDSVEKIMNDSIIDEFEDNDYL